MFLCFVKDIVWLNFREGKSRASYSVICGFVLSVVGETFRPPESDRSRWSLFPQAEHNPFGRLHTLSFSHCLPHTDSLRRSLSHILFDTIVFFYVLLKTHKHFGRLHTLSSSHCPPHTDALRQPLSHILFNTPLPQSLFEKLLLSQSLRSLI